MPIYEYSCGECGEEFQTIILNKGEEDTLVCPHCGAEDLKRLISRVSFHTPESQRLAEYNPNAPQDDSFYKDSRNIGLHAQKRAKQMGVDLGNGFNKKLEKLRTDPGSVLRDSD